MISDRDEDKKNSDVVVEKRDESENRLEKKSGLDKNLVEVRTKSSAVRKRSTSGRTFLEQA